MLEWLLKKLMIKPMERAEFEALSSSGSDDAHSERPGFDVDPALVPAEVHRMFQVMNLHGSHPLVQHHFHQVTIITFASAAGEGIVYWPEFRDGDFAALVWDDGKGLWGSGGWIPLAHPGADITCGPSQFNDEYIRNAPVFRDLPLLLDHLFGTRPSAGQM